MVTADSAGLSGYDRVFCDVEEGGGIWILTQSAQSSRRRGGEEEWIDRFGDRQTYTTVAGLVLIVNNLMSLMDDNSNEEV